MARWCLRRRSGCSPYVLAVWLRRFSPTTRATGVAQTGPQRLYGVGAYVDAHFSRWVQPEFEMRWGRFNEYACNGQYPGIDENTYSIGDRIPIKNFHKFTPYGKVLVGLGNGSWLTGTAFVITYGGGVDYRLNRKFTIRCADFEYQQWPVTSPNSTRRHYLLHRLALWPQRRRELQNLLRTGNRPSSQ